MFLPDSLAHPAQMMTSADLAVLAGMEIEPPEDHTLHRRDEFVSELRAQQSDETLEARLVFLARWSSLGGALAETNSTTARMILKLRPLGRDRYLVWCSAVGPSGPLETWFQRLRYKVPFDAESVRNDFRERLNAAPGVDIPVAKLSVRPSVPLAVFADPGAAVALTEAFGWLIHEARIAVDTPADET